MLKVTNSLTQEQLKEQFGNHLEVCVSVHNFERRWCWQLSSLLEQGAPVLVTAAFIEKTGTPTALEVADYFNSLGGSLYVRMMPYPDEERFQFRGLVRTDQVKVSVGKRILFTDADMLVPPGWCESALSPDFPDHNCLHTGRYSTILDETNALVNSKSYPCEVNGVWGVVSKMQAVKMADIGAGFCQIIGGDFIRNRGHYIAENENRDGRWSRKAIYRSDKQFRTAVGKLSVPLPYMFHLQHERDTTSDHHLTNQR